MAGHSKFANIKHKKAKNDAAKGKIFTKLGREIMVAVREGGSDPTMNSRLREVIAKAKANNMPNDTLDRAIKKGAGDKDGVDYEKIRYEGYGPNGVAIIVDVLTDNRNRAAANVRNAFTKGNGNMGTAGCVSFMFEELGIIMIEKDDVQEDIIMEDSLESGAADCIIHEEGFEIRTERNDFLKVKETLEEKSYNILSAEVTMICGTDAILTDEEDIKKMRKLLALLEDDDDVQEVYHNLIDFEE